MELLNESGEGFRMHAVGGLEIVNRGGCVLYVPPQDMKKLCEFMLECCAVQQKMTAIADTLELPYQAGA